MGNKGFIKGVYKALIIAICVIILMPLPMNVEAGTEYNPPSENGGMTNPGGKHWINHNSDQYHSIYGDNALVDGGEGLDDAYGEEVEAGFLSGILGEFFGNIANMLYDIFNTANIDLTIDGIVYGRVKPTTTLTRVNGEWANMQMNLVHFGLEKNNAWGIFGALLYRTLRNRFAFILIPCIGIFMLGKEAFKGGEKGRAGVKIVMTKLVAFFVIMYAVPFILEAYIYIRDVLMVVVREGLSGPLKGLNNSIVGTGGIYASIKTSWGKLGHPFLLGLIMLGYACAGLVYFWDYIRIALLIAAVFGLFPLILIWWFFKPKIITDWLNLVLPSLLTPFIDMVLLLAPCFVMAMFQRIFSLNAEGAGTSVILAITILACMWVMRSVRDRILKLFGFEGIRGGSGGLGLALAMLARNFGGGGHRGGDLGGRESAGEGRGSASRAADQMRETNEVLKNADSAIAEINSDDYTSDTGYANETGDWVSEMNEEGSTVEREGIDMDDETVSSEDRAVNEDVLSESELADMDSGLSGDVGDDVKTMASYAEDVLETAGGAVETMAEGVGRIGASVSEENMLANRAELRDVSLEGSDEIGSAMGNSIAAARAELPVSVLNEEQSKFVDSLSDRDKKRFSNLQQVDALESGIAKNERIMAESGYNRGVYDAAVSKGKELSSRMESLNTEKSGFGQRLATLESERSTGSISADEYSRRKDMIATEQQRNQSSINEVVAAQKANNTYLESMQSSYMADRQNVAYKNELDARRGVESQYAHNSGLAGMSTKSYSNANDFLHQKRVDDIKKKHVNYANFDTKQYENILSPSEREELYRKRATRETINKVERAIENTVGVGIGTVAAAGAVFAGPGAMAGAAMVGSNVGKKVVHVAEPVVEGTVKIVDAGGKKLYSAVDTRPVGGTVSKGSGNNTQTQGVVSERTHGSSGSAGKSAQKAKKGDIGDSEMKGRDRAAEKYTDKM